MGNLGRYQLMTTLAKKVGGPDTFMGALVGAGVIIGVGGTVIALKVKKSIAKKNKEKEAAAAEERIYTVVTEGVSNEGVEFHTGDQFKVLAQDGDAVLIEKIGDADNPYFVARDLLEVISDYGL